MTMNFVKMIFDIFEHRSKSNIGQAPPRADSIPRVGTPTKYITLTAVKRKQER